MPDTLHFDGSCDPNPGGRLGFGWVLTLDGETTTGRGEESPARSNTNNIGEYRGLIAGLRAYLESGRSGPLTVIGDSQLIIGQVTATMRAKQPQLAQLCAEARRLTQQIRGGATFEWRRRAQNSAADALASDGNSTLPPPAARTYAEGCVPAPTLGQAYEQRSHSSTRAQHQASRNFSSLVLAGQMRSPPRSCPSLRLRPGRRRRKPSSPHFPITQPARRLCCAGACVV